MVWISSTKVMTSPAASVISLRTAFSALRTRRGTWRRPACTDVERDQPLVLQSLGQVAVGDAPGQTLDDGGLADAGLADEDRVVLGAAAEHLDDPADLVVTADDGVDLALVGAGVRSWPYFSRAANCSSGFWPGDAVAAAHLFQG